MWFPPYELGFDDSSTPGFTETDFIGRPDLFILIKVRNEVVV